MILEDLFTVSSLTASANKLPPIPTKLGASGLFTEKGITTTYMTVDEKNGRLILVPNTSRNNDPEPLKNGGRTRRVFEATHLPVTRTIMANDLQNIVAFGEDGVLQQQAQVINDKLQEMVNSVEATREWQRMGAVSGKILDADGSVLFDLFNEFGVTKKTTAVPLSNASTKVMKYCLDAKRWAETKLGGVMVTGFRSYCDSVFFDLVTGHPTVQAAFANYQAAQDRLGGDMRSGFTYGGIEFIEYEVAVSGQKFIPEGTAKVFPIAPGVFTMTNSPANYNETLNTLGKPFYAKSEARKMGKGWDLEVQANPLAMCLYPEALVELTAA